MTKEINHECTRINTNEKRDCHATLAMTKSIPAAPAARLLYGGKMINNLQVPLGQDPGANGDVNGLLKFANTNPGKQVAGAK
ncbi:MAG: hypothetical protein K8R02_07400 [Anaerohalosphaeraceae bacterium]|nr:hypothetical protein [Anaerohalosphaeraceae bacterium]